MEDSRLDQIAALADDARCLAAEVADECGALEYDLLTSIRAHLNIAIEDVNKLKEMPYDVV